MKSNLCDQDIRTKAYAAIDGQNLLLIDRLLMNVLEDDPYVNRLLQKICMLNFKNPCTVDIHEVKKAIYYAKKYHSDQKRQSGEPYYSHPIEVAYMVTDYCFKTDIIITSILQTSSKILILLYRW